MLAISVAMIGMIVVFVAILVAAVKLVIEAGFCFLSLLPLFVVFWMAKILIETLGRTIRDIKSGDIYK